MKDKNIVGIEKTKKYTYKRLINLKIRKNLVIMKINESSFFISRNELENFLKENTKLIENK